MAVRRRHLPRLARWSVGGGRWPSRVAHGAGVGCLGGPRPEARRRRTCCREACRCSLAPPLPQRPSSRPRCPASSAGACGWCQGSPRGRDAVGLEGGGGPALPPGVPHAPWETRAGARAPPPRGWAWSPRRASPRRRIAAVPGQGRGAGRLWGHTRPVPRCTPRGRHPSVSWAQWPRHGAPGGSPRHPPAGRGAEGCRRAGRGRPGPRRGAGRRRGRLPAGPWWVAAQRPAARTRRRGEHPRRGPSPHGP